MYAPGFESRGRASVRAARCVLYCTDSVVKKNRRLPKVQKLEQPSYSVVMWTAGVLRHKLQGYHGIRNFIDHVNNEPERRVCVSVCLCERYPAAVAAAAAAPSDQ